MNNWKVEEMKLMNMSEWEVKDLVRSTSREEMISEIDEWSDGVLSYIIDLKAKYDAEKDTVIKKDQHGHISYSSYQSWIKKNDTRKIAHTDGGWEYIGKIHFGKLNLGYGYLRLQGFDMDAHYRDGYYSSDKSVLTYLYSSLISARISAEKDYFKNHDPYELKKEEFRNTPHVGLICECGYCSDGSIYLYDDVEITIEQMDEIISKAKEVSAFIEAKRAELSF